MESKITVLVFILFFGVMDTYSQKETDSLMQVWKNDGSPVMDRLTAIGDVVWYKYLKSHPDSAIYYCQLQYELARDSNIQIKMVSARNTQGIAAKNLGRYKEAIVYQKEALDLIIELDIKKHIASAYTNLANTYNYLGQFQKSIDLHKKSLEISRELGNHSGIATSYNSLGMAFSNIGENDIALMYYQMALKIRQEQNNIVGVSIILSNIANILKDKGDFHGALLINEEALSYKIELRDTLRIAGSYNNIGSIYFDQGLIKEAQKYYHKSLTLRTQKTDVAGMSATLNNLGLTYEFLADYSKDEDIRNKNYSEALKYYYRSLTYSRSSGYHVSEINTLNNISSVQASMGHEQLAIIYSDSAMALSSESHYLFGEANAKMNIAEYYFRHSQYEKAGNLYHEVLKMSGSDIAEFQRMASSGLFKCYVFLKRIAKAKEKLIELLEARSSDIQNNFFFLSEREKELYLKTLESDFMQLYDFTALNPTDSLLLCMSYDQALFYKSLLLKSSTALGKAINASKDTVLIKEYQLWLSLKKRLIDHVGIGKETVSLEDSVNQMEKQLISRFELFSDFQEFQYLGWKDVQKGLDKNEAAIEFIHYNSLLDGKTHYSALVLRPKYKTPELIELCLEEDLEKLIKESDGNSKTIVNKIYGTKTNPSNELYNLIWKPLNKALKGVKNINISPSGLLHKVSFASISNEEKQYLVDAYKLQMSVSTANERFTGLLKLSLEDSISLIGGLQYNDQNTSEEVWSYLPGTLSEIMLLSSAFDSLGLEYELYRELEASEKHVIALAEKSKIFHIATHGFFFPNPTRLLSYNDDQEMVSGEVHFRGKNERSYAHWNFVRSENPLMRSGLVLSGANEVWNGSGDKEFGNDGILTAQEIATLDLHRMELVILSACETGLGDIKGFEGVYGLQRAFKMAGVKFIIMSLWQVPDKETAEFMHLFYLNLTTSQDVGVAFSNTQKEMSRKYDPFFWGAFVLMN